MINEDFITLKTNFKDIDKIITARYIGIQLNNNRTNDCNTFLKRLYILILLALFSIFLLLFTNIFLEIIN